MNVKSYCSACFLLFLGLLVHPEYQARATGPEPVGWYAGDMHVHRSCGDSPVPVSTVYNAMLGQNLAVVSLLADMGNGEVQDPTTDLPLVNGTDDPISTPGHIVHWDAEWHWDATYFQYPHQALGGHIVALGLSEAYQVWQEYTFPIFQWAHQRNAIAGFAHMQYLDNGIPQTLDCCVPIEYPVEVALGSCDFLDEDVDGGDSAILAYYRLLNCGFRPGFAGGSDYPCGAPVGSVMTYVQVQGELTYRAWINGIASGRTVVSRNGDNEFLDLQVNGSASPGDEVKLTGTGSVQVDIQWTAIEALSGTIELVQNGMVVSSTPATVNSGTGATMSGTVSFSRSGWLAARRMSSRGHEVQTSAVFVTINNAPIRTSADDANFYVAWMDNLLAMTSPGGAWNSYFPTSLAAAQGRYQAARAVYEQIALDAAQGGPLAISTSVLPDGGVNVPYLSSVAASGGASPYTWSITDGALPPGLTLQATTGNVAGTPTLTGEFSFTTRVSDGSSPMQSATMPLSITIASIPDVSLWPISTVPTLSDGGADNSVEVGVKFRSDTAGFIIGIRFFKAIANIGNHVGNLWTSSGTPIATGTFTGETESGWQQVNFAPVAITSNTTYIASYHANTGHYSGDVNYFSATGFDNPPLHALANGASGGNGVYAYGANSLFPNQTWDSCNYWVDVVFRASNTPSLTSISLTPANATILSGSTQHVTATGIYSDGGTQNITSLVTWASSNPAVATIDGAGLATAVSPGVTNISAALAGISGTGTLTVQSSFTSIWPGTAKPGLVDDGADNPVELGVKFKSDAAGTITGIRFYKASTNTGDHIGNFWSGAGALLATGTFAGESASGWQQVNFATPVAIAAGTVYVASYHANTGHYSEDDDYFSGQGVDNPPLHALANGISGGNGVYAYGASSAFPDLTWNSANYWVDVVLQSGSSAASPLTIATTALAGGTVELPYAGTLAAMGGTPPYIWSITSGALPPGLSLNPASGAITGTATLTGTFSFTTQVHDSGSPVQTAAIPLNIAVGALPATASIWTTATVPGTVDGGPDSSVEIGVKFRSDVAGTITGLRFYKALTNTSTHVGNLWTSSGTPLASATFTGETASGWQQINFTTPVVIAANTVYVASYHANNGHYSDDISYFSGIGVDTPPLHALADGVSGANGIYAYGPTSAFPTQTWFSSNYWVDVVFVPGP